MRLVMLTENTSASEKLRAEHGFSAYVEHLGGKYLIDTGAGDCFVHNARRLGIDISDVSALCVSHNHDDHTGGIESFLRINKKAAVFAKKAALAETFSKIAFLYFPIGKIKHLSEKHGSRFVLFNNFQEIAPNFFLVSNEVFDKDFYCKSKNLYRSYSQEDGKSGIFRDDYSHECFAVIFPQEDKKRGCVIVSPCSHNGIVNIIKTVQNTWPDSPVLSIVGGFHFMGSSAKKLGCSEEYIGKVAAEIRRLGVGQVFTCHCTGINGYKALKTILGDQIQYLQTGEEISYG